MAPHVLHLEKTVDVGGVDLLQRGEGGGRAETKVGRSEARRGRQGNVRQASAGLSACRGEE